MKRTTKAFTLVELLVVISIIALLLAILMPALAKVREQGRAIVCASNIKNYGPCLLMFAQDNNGKCPFSFTTLYSHTTLGLFSGDPSPKCPEACRWHYDGDEPDGSLVPYLKTMDVHMCPTFKNFAMAGGLNGCPNAKTGHSSRGGRAGAMPFNPRYSYSMNRWIGLYEPRIYFTAVGSEEYDRLIRTEPSLKLSNVKRTSQCFSFSEENLWAINISPSNRGSADRYNHVYRSGDTKIYSGMALVKTDMWMYALNNGSAISNFATYHGVSAAKCDEGKANVLFVDGHVSRIKGLPGYDAYMEYGRPYYGHEKGQIW